MSKQEQALTFLGIFNWTGYAFIHDTRFVISFGFCNPWGNYHSQVDKLGDSFIPDFAQGRIDIKQ